MDTQPLYKSIKSNPLRDKELFDSTGKKIRGKEILIGVESKDEQRRLFYLTEEDLSTHTLLLGATGVGKTVLLTTVLCQFIRNGWPVFIYDFKGDEELLKAAYFTAYLSGRHNDFKIFNPTAAITTSGWMGELGTCTYNPSVSIKSATALSNAELRAAEGKSNGTVEYWSKVQEGTIKKLNAAMVGTGKAFSARDKWVALLRQDAMQIMINETTDYDARLYWENIYAQWQRKPDEYDKQIRGTMMFYERFGSGDFAKILNSYTPEITAVDAYSTNKIIYNILPSMSLLSDARSIAKLQLSEILSLAGQIQSSFSVKKPCLILIDEARHAIFEGFSDALAQGRSAGFWTFMGLQSIKQIDQEACADYRQELQTNLRTTIVMSTGNDHISAEEFSKMFGEYGMKSNTRCGDITLTDASSRVVSATDIMAMGNFKMVVRAPQHGDGSEIEFHRGHVVSLFNAREINMGTDCPRPRFDTPADRDNGLRLFERVMPQGVQ